MVKQLHAVRQTTEPVASALESPQSFAKFLRVSGQAVRNWVKDGTIPCVIHTGRIIRFERAAAIEALKKGAPAL